MLSHAFPGTDKSGLEKVKRFWQGLGAKVKVLDARTHDKILAFTSHLPHLVVFGLLDCLKSDYLEFAAGGLKDTTRIGLSDPLLWRDIFLTNRKEVLKAIKAFKKSFKRLEETIVRNQPGKLVSLLRKFPGTNAMPFNPHPKKMIIAIDGPAGSRQVHYFPPGG